MGEERLTTLAKRLRPFFGGQIGAMAAAGALMDEGPGIDLIGKVIGFGGDTVLVYHTAGNPVTEYAFTAVGLAAALAAATSGEWVRINAAGSITGNFTVPAGVVLITDSQIQTTIIGTITLGAGAVIFNLNIAAVANDANALYGVLGSTGAVSYLFDCNVHATQSGAGNAYAVGAINGHAVGDGDVYVYRCRLHGISVGGSGYAARSTAGLFKMWHGSAYGSTARWVQV